MIKPFFFLSIELLQARDPSVLDGLRHLLIKACGQGAGPLGIGEDVEGGAVAFLQESERVGKMFFRLTGEPNEDVDADGRIQHHFSAQGNGFHEFPAGIAPAHAAENGVIAALQGDMEMGQEVLLFGHKGEQLLADFFGFNGAEAKTDVRMGAAESAHQLHAIGFFLNSRAQILSVEPNMDAGDHHLAVSFGLEDGRLLENFFQGQAAAGAAGVGDDAVGAEIIAAVLHPEAGAGPTPEVTHGQMADLFFLQDRGHEHSRVARSGAERSLHQLLLVGVADNADGRIDQLRQFLAGHLGITAGDNDSCFGVLADELTDNMSGLSPGTGSDGAGVDHNDISTFLGADHAAAGSLKAALEGGGFILVDLAAKGADGNFLHSFQGVLVSY
ncbi:MAG: hypothetical protein FD168_287 [Desulfobulbaceae bacterium]|nr:MAG: hypothetical protein FD168_287 [Desulfobulbaceae bacterium]